LLAYHLRRCEASIGPDLDVDAVLGLGDVAG
jgi:hypothetical protein